MGSGCCRARQVPTPRFNTQGSGSPVSKRNSSVTGYSSLFSSKTSLWLLRVLGELRREPRRRLQSSRCQSSDSKAHGSATSYRFSVRVHFVFFVFVFFMFRFKKCFYFLKKNPLFMFACLHVVVHVAFRCFQFSLFLCVFSRTLAEHWGHRPQQRTRILNTPLHWCKFHAHSFARTTRTTRTRTTISWFFDLILQNLRFHRKQLRAHVPR